MIQKLRIQAKKLVPSFYVFSRKFSEYWWLFQSRRTKSRQNFTDCYWPLNEAFLQYQRIQDSNISPCLTATDSKQSLKMLKASLLRILAVKKVSVLINNRDCSKTWNINSKSFFYFSTAAMPAPLKHMSFQSTNVIVKMPKRKSTQKLGSFSVTPW